MNELAIWNMALSQAGGRYQLATTSDEGPAADLCRLWYVPARDFVFAKAYWPEVGKTAKLALVKERDFTLDWTDGDPPPDWRFAYAVPSDMRKPFDIYDAKQLMDQAPAPYAWQRIDRAYTVSLVQNTQCICTNVENAVLTYSGINTNPAFWYPSLRYAVAMRLAADIIFPLSTDAALRAEAEKVFTVRLTEAQLAAANLDQEFLPDGDLGSSLESRTGYAPDWKNPYARR